MKLLIKAGLAAIVLLAIFILVIEGYQMLKSE